jgi:predicted metalloprotease with PDZ domain
VGKTGTTPFRAAPEKPSRGMLEFAREVWQLSIVLQVIHEVSVFDANAHLLRVKTLVRRSDGEAFGTPVTLFMPVWTPGSYLVREYARHVEVLTARAGQTALTCRKIRKNAWEVDARGVREVEIEYRLYANELTVRTNHVDATHAYWNGAATFLAVEQEAGAGARVNVAMPEGWTIATALWPDPAAPERRFTAATFDELCDAPFECGKLIERSFTALGRPHRLAAWDNPDARAVDWDKLAADTKIIVETEVGLFADPRGTPPYQRYLFLWYVTPRGQGGLEHRDCTTLMARPASFTSRSGYLDVLSLIAHEFFHLWNVKRIRPAGLVPYRYQEENYTRLLWWFEGATSYYDWRVLRLANLCTAGEYLGHLADRIGRLLDTPGSEVHPLEEASFDAWIKAYRPDENSLNSTVSYYLKGEVVCALFDIEIRHRSQGKASLDDIVRRLRAKYADPEAPVPEDGLPQVFADVAGFSLDEAFARWVRGTEALPLADVLGHAGLTLERTPRSGGPPVSLGLRLKLEAGHTIVEAVPRGSPAHRAGIDVRDEIMAVAERRVPDGRLELPLAGLAPGDRVPILVARDGWVRTCEIILDPPALGDVKIVARADAPESARELYQAWLGEPWMPATKSRAENERRDDAGKKRE